MKKKTILIAGHRGLIGSELSRQHVGHKIMPVERADFELNDMAFIRKFESADLIMNFAGHPIINRWTPRNRKKILNSRLHTTQKLGLIMEKGNMKNRHYIGASAIGVYPETGSHTEKSNLKGEGFMREVVDDWEKETYLLKNDLTIVSILRLGVVLSSQGGVMKRLLPLFEMGLGGKIGNGRQAFSWIHIKDLVKAVHHIIERKEEGIYNLVAPGICSNSDFTKELGRATNKPAWLMIPEFALRLKYGKAASVITGGQTVLPERLMEEKFQFDYPDLPDALSDIVN